MSRHRNVRNMIADDYDDYGDDYDDYGDDYDDYGDYGAGYAATPKKKQQQQQQQQAKQQPTSKPKQPFVPKKKKNVVASQAPTTTTTKAAGAAAAATSAGGGGSVGITVLSAGSSKPPASASQTAAAAAIAPPTARPPPGFAGAAVGAAVNKASLAAAPASSGPASSVGAAAAVGQTTQSMQSLPPPPVPSELLKQDGNDTTSKKQHLTLVILGHVDAGKSTVTGHLLYGGNKGGNRRGGKPQNFAWLLDEDEQERAHGITMDIATKTLTTKRYNVVVQDAPGHADYVPSAITGTANANAALLVIDSTDYQTSFESGQFKQHAFLARGLGVIQILVVINKMDLINWSQDKYNAIQNAAMNFLIQTVGYPSAAVRCVPVSGITGANVHARSTAGEGDGADDDDEASLMSWYKGPTLVDAIDNFFAGGGGGKGGGGGANAKANLLNMHLRLVLTDVVGESGKANRTSVRAKIMQGWLKSGEQLTMLPLGDSTTIQKLSSLHGGGDSGSPDNNIMYAGAGEMIDMVLGGVDTSRVLVGNTLCRPNSRPPTANKCRARIWVMEGLVPIIRGSHAIFHIHHLNIPCHVTKLLHTINPKDSSGGILKKNPRAIGASTQAVVEITLNNSCVMESFDDCRALGRFVLRRGGDSIAIGRIEQVLV